jgi:glycine/D-amino acid oxidase-like deaminating enzyme
MKSYDAIVVGGGVIGSSIAFHLASLGMRNVALMEREQIGSGTTAQSSGILRTHYSVPENVTLARHSWDVFRNFPVYLNDHEASCGLVACGYMIVAPEGERALALQASLGHQRNHGIRADEIDVRRARDLMPLADFSDAAVIGYEPDAGFADAYLVTTAFARAARRLGVTLMESTTATGLLRQGERVCGVTTSRGDFGSGLVVSAQNIWASEVAAWSGLALPLCRERHSVMTLACDAHYTNAMPVFKDLASAGMLYYRSYGGTQMLVSEGGAGEAMETIDTNQGDVPLDTVAAVGEQVAQRFPAYAAAGLASSWTGVYDVTPDWNPVLGHAPGIDGLLLAYGFSGHGFKLSPMVGKLMAQAALGLPTDVSLAPYALERFTTGRMLRGRYGLGAVS